ncbi:MAG TPA: hypothetical protein VF814_18225 [Casimicrobiaceae bacterium]
MNGENNHIFRASALDGYVPAPRPRRFTWALLWAQLWLLAAFVGMSLIAIAAKLVLGDAQARPAAALALATIGALATGASWWNVARRLGHAELGSGETQFSPTTSTESRQLPLVLHR